MNIDDLPSPTSQKLDIDSLPAPPKQPDAASTRFGRGVGQLYTGLGNLALQGYANVLDATHMPWNQAAAVKVRQLAESPASAQQELTAKEKAGAPEGIDWANIGGQSMLPIPAEAAVPRMLVGGIQGAALAPTEGNDPTVAGAAGAAAAGVLPWGIKKVAGAFAPTIDAGRKALLESGVKLTPGQLIESLKSVEEKVKSWPVIGHLIKGAEHESFASLNDAIGNDALSSIGGSIPKGVRGGEAVDAARNQISERYNDILSKGSIPTSTQPGVRSGLVQGFLGIENDLRQRGLDKAADEFKAIVKNEVEGHLASPTQDLSGEVYKSIDSQLKKYARDYRSDTTLSPVNRNALIDALGDAQSGMRSAFDHYNPQLAGELQPVDLAYAKYLRYERASKAANGEIFTPKQYLSATGAMDSSLRKNAFARGQAFMQGAAQNAQNVMGNSIPNSGSADRALTAVIADRIFEGRLPSGVVAKGAMLAAPLVLPYTKLGGAAFRSYMNPSDKRKLLAALVAQGIGKPVGALSPALMQSIPNARNSPVEQTP